MTEFEKLLRQAQAHDEGAMLTLMCGFVWKMIGACRGFDMGRDDDMQSYMMLRFIEDVYDFII